jgi:hypothetical protein
MKNLQRDKLRPGDPGALKVKEDGTIAAINGRAHRVVVLRERGIEVDQLPREILP